MASVLILTFKQRAKGAKRKRNVLFLSVIKKAGRYGKLFVYFMAAKAFISTFIIPVSTAPCDRHLL